jgi:hypothetical protein
MSASTTTPADQPSPQIAQVPDTMSDAARSKGCWSLGSAVERHNCARIADTTTSTLPSAPEPSVKSTKLDQSSSSTSSGLLPFVLLAAAAYATIAFLRRHLRKRHLLAKYGDSEIVRRIMKRQIWHGMTKAQLLDSWGNPHDIDTLIMKTKDKRTFKYNRIGKRRYTRRAYVEDDRVVGWEIK